MCACWCVCVSFCEVCVRGLFGGFLPDVRGITCDQQTVEGVSSLNNPSPGLRFGPLFVFLTTGRKDTRLGFGCGSAMVDASSSVPYATAASAAHNQHSLLSLRWRTTCTSCIRQQFYGGLCKVEGGSFCEPTRLAAAPSEYLYGEGLPSCRSS